MKIKKGFVVREVGGENIAVPIGEMAKEFHGMIKLNDSALFLWNFFNDDRTRDEAVAALIGEYEITEEEAIKGVDSFIKLVTDNGFADR